MLYYEMFQLTNLGVNYEKNYVCVLTLRIFADGRKNQSADHRQQLYSEFEETSFGNRRGCR